MKNSNNKPNTFVLKISLPFLLLSLAAVQTHALNKTKGSSSKGESIAIKSCDRCHGELGISDDTDTPHLAAQSSSYIIKQLQDYKSKLRNDKNMYKRVKRLSKQDMADLGTWYSQQTLPELDTSLKNTIKAPALITQGDTNRNIPPCELCHGKDGKTSIGDVPILAGQQAGYLLSTMEYFADGSRANDQGGTMQGLVKNLSDVEIEALAKYYSELGARPAEFD